MPLFAYCPGRLVRKVELTRHAYRADDIHVLGTADYVSGDIHDELIRTNEFPAPVAAAMQGIVDRFYQDLAAGVRQQNAADASSGQISADGEDTVVVNPGPIVEAARARANETYRTLFGDDAYNRLTMNTALEVQPAMAAGDAAK